MRFPRASGILLHPTSFPSAFGIGDLGAGAFSFLDFMVESGQHIWQVMPLGPTGYGDSPYQCFSAFAGNPLLVSPELLVAEGYLAPQDIADKPAFPNDRVDYGPVIQYKAMLLDRAFARFQAHGTAEQRDRFDAFCRANAGWLDDFALFMALKKHHGGAVWNNWDLEIATRRPEAVARWSGELAEPMRREMVLQFLFFQQWLAVKAYANERGIRIIGDIPIFVAYDSVDAWANPDLFHFDPQGRSTHVAGVPPDYFSPTGQLWGNPLYRWDRMAERGYSWWVERFRMMLTMVDLVRLDHFRGFQAYWEVPASEPTAINGRWVEGPGPALFQAVQRALGADLPIIAEDLGIITPKVDALRLGFGLPGMKVLQFAFGGGPHHKYLPHTYEPNCVVYTGTHDNDTSIGWFATRGAKERALVQRYLARDGQDIAWDLMRLASGSVADTAIAPLQDILRLGSEARMNTPGQPGGNWSWRYRPEALTPELAWHLCEMAHLYGRLPVEEEEEETAVAGLP